MDNTEYTVCNVCHNRVHRSLYDLHMRSHATYDPFSGLVDFSAVLAEFRQRHGQDNSTTTFPPRSMNLPPSAPSISSSAMGISRLLELYSTGIDTFPSASSQALGNFLHNFETITQNTNINANANINTNAQAPPSYRDILQTEIQQEEEQQGLNSPRPTTAFQYMSYVYNPVNQDFDYTANTNSNQPYWFSTTPPQENSRTPPPPAFNMFGGNTRQTTHPSSFNMLGNIALEMLAVIEESMFDDYETNIRLAERVGVVEVGIDNIDDVSSFISREEVSADDICTICLDKMRDKENETYRKLICGHKYCNECITQWLAKSKKCPVCNIDLEERLNVTNTHEQGR